MKRILRNVLIGLASLVLLAFLVGTALYVKKREDRERKIRLTRR